ncbi:hypothetical protein C0Q70_03679 [Pomacea canaliculata]|uniref:U2A'/phosphoprotein 32 family A C-terminal domain-containing protein n=1 Tax=Pomacea canaliculata TaxID=400727 RepID=A0A2T7PTD5_POMCA|nr:uncharacterized protein LOC112557082 isoform X2 [Pomacea canaliculata]PVD36693.1 hypothetical protein C0Q70_03679 [Pomacea canaliculata]
MADNARSSDKGTSPQSEDAYESGPNVTHSSIPFTVVQFRSPHNDSSEHRDPIPQLPSRNFQFSLWHDLKECDVHGSQLKAPRIRRGPAEKDKAFYLMTDEKNSRIHHDIHGRHKDTHRDNLESWEVAQLASFPSQDLHHGYQKSNLSRILGRLKQVTYLNLRDNALVDLSSFTFPCCEYLNLNNNFLTSFKKLPKISRVKYLTMLDNDITNFNGLSDLRSTPLEELFLLGNPVAFQIGYRQRVFAILPGLKFLDGVAKQDEDSKPPPPDEKPSSCVVS